MEKTPKRDSPIKALSLLLEQYESCPEPSLNHFARLLRWQTDLFERLEKAARTQGGMGVGKLLQSEESPFQMGGADVYGGGEDRWYFYYWAILFPERFVWNPKALLGEPGYVLKEGEAVGKREKAVILGLLTSPTGRSLLFRETIEGIRGRFGRRPPWPEEVSRDVDALIGSLSVCPICGELFVGERKDQRFDKEFCRKKAHAVPSYKREDQTARIYFYRMIKRKIPRAEAWENTLKKHGETLKKLGLDGPKPPRTWAQNKEG